MSPAGRSQPGRRGGWARGSRSGGRGRGCGTARPCLGVGQLSRWLVSPGLRVPHPCQGGDRVLTHAELSLGVQLEALRAAGFTLICKAERMGPQGTECEGQRAAPAAAQARCFLPPAWPGRGLSPEPMSPFPAQVLS